MNIKQDNIADRENMEQSFESIQELGDCYTSIGELEKAKQAFAKAAVLAPDESEPYIGLGTVALQEEKLEDAKIAFKVASRLDRNSSKAYAGLAMVAHQNKDYQNAFQMYLNCLELDTDNLTALLGLFQVSCQMGSFAKVIQYLETYLDTHPDDVPVIFSLAALYLKESNLERSREMLLRIMTLDAANNDAADLLEEVEHRLANLAGV